MRHPSLRDDECSCTMYATHDMQTERFQNAPVRANVLVLLRGIVHTVGPLYIRYTIPYRTHMRRTTVPTRCRGTNTTTELTLTTTCMHLLSFYSLQCPEPIY